MHITKLSYVPLFAFSLGDVFRIFGIKTSPPNNKENAVGEILIPWLGNPGRPGQMHTTAAEYRQLYTDT